MPPLLILAWLVFLKFKVARLEQKSFFLVLAATFCAAAGIEFVMVFFLRSIHR